MWTGIFADCVPSALLMINVMGCGFLLLAWFGLHCFEDK
jgi:hypothetical protein